MSDLRFDQRVQLTVPRAPRDGVAVGKAILIGEHFVVHGAPALAVPVAGRAVRVRVSPGAGAWRCGDAGRAHIEALLVRLRLAPDEMAVEVDATLPVGMGLGSSAALAVALLRALDAPPDRVRELAHDLERVAHGTPSGVDDAVVALERPVWFVRGSPVEPLTWPSRPPLVIATTPRHGTTQIAVAAVRRWADGHPSRFAALLAAATADAEAARRALEAGRWDVLGALLDRAHDRLRDVGVSNAALDRLCDAARSAGAFGAKLTGAGLGGAMIALARDPVDVAAALGEAGALEVFAA